MTLSELAPVAGLYLWWLVANGVRFYAEYDFLQRFTGEAGHLRYGGLLYLGVNSLCTVLAITLPVPGIVWELPHGLFLWGFAMLGLGLGWKQVIAPAAILLSLTTLMEGVSAAVMRPLSTGLNAPLLGQLAHVAMTAVTTVGLLLLLRLLARRYGAMAQKPLLSQLHLLLLPCAFAVGVVRVGLGLDSTAVLPSGVPPASGPPLWAFLCVAGAAATFFAVLEGFGRVAGLAEREKEAALLGEQLRRQRSYLDEAGRREDRYRAFRHDIQNHLLVLSGLLEREHYREAHQYFQRLTAAAETLRVPVDTGSPVLDVLLGEKMGYAAQHQITIHYAVRLPAGGGVEDMDLCVVLANGLDNAIAACLRTGGRDIHVTVGARHGFLLIEVKNPYPAAPPPEFGTGLRNVAQIAARYGGTLETENSGGAFRLSVLLCCGQGRGTPLA